jgi:hypothetical protein
MPSEGTKISSLTLFDGKDLTDSVPFSGGDPFNTYRMTVEELLNAGRTGLTGGGTANLNGVATLNEAVTQVWQVADGATMSPYQLMVGSLAQSLPNVVRPLDFDGTNNPKYFQLLGFKGIQMVMTGTAGNGFVELPAQSVAPATPTGAMRLYANATSQPSWVQPDGYTRTFASTLTASRTYTLPDTTGTLVVGNYVPTVAGTSGQVLVNGGTAAASGAVTASLPTDLVSINSVTAVVGSNLTLTSGNASTRIILNGASSGNVTAAQGVLGDFAANNLNVSPCFTATNASTIDTLGVYRIGGDINGGGGINFFIASTNNVTITNAATLLLNGPVTAAAGTTITNSWAIYSAFGGAVFAGDLVGSRGFSGFRATNVGPSGNSAGTHVVASSTNNDTGSVSINTRNSTTVAPYYAVIKNPGGTLTTAGSLTSAAVSSTSVLGHFYFCGGDGTSWPKGAAITGTVEGTVSTGVVPTRLDFKTATSTGTLTTALSINPAQVVSITSTAANGGAAMVITASGQGYSGFQSVKGSVTALYGVTSSSTTNSFGATISCATAVSLLTAGTFRLAPTGRLTYGQNGGNISAVLEQAGVWGTRGAYGSFRTADNGQTFSSVAVINDFTAPGGTEAASVFWEFNAPQIGALNAITTTDAATIWIGGGPVNVANNTLTNSWGLWNAGATRLDGSVRVGGNVATTATSGFLYLTTCAGVPSGTPASIGGAPFVVDSVNSKLYGYIGSQWVPLGSGGNLTTVFGSSPFLGQNVIQPEEIVIGMTGLTMKGSGVYITSLALRADGRSLTLGANLEELVGGFAAAHINDLNGGATILYRAGNPVGYIHASAANAVTVGAWSEVADTQTRIVGGTGGITFNRGIAVNGAVWSATTALLTTAGTASQSSLRIPAGTAPSSPNEGDMWYEGGSLKFCAAGGQVKTLNWS